mmetsp:Transcript_4250/g.9480  ORF Transcript_4250/g.9480 Transcript_4250/m.9480 type:complete len:209 (-) Transcript_4250:391-1017(-)|eukprot:CAMPEP_0171354920 /NCGR_PEP_ID=MMETSP0878-20121228/44957_1 /TAXON_ID=67004 /ORGANISM="Thalassiosira weissflogii, Strain CCMP1336" /LENGTH=208 /DNA_ID=CAMNT_0011860911 /DNA_START=383 /DNA_END=1009 /DNA_ORIENTATION=+
MGNTLPISSPPKPTPSRAVLYMIPESMCGKTRILNSDELPPALDGTVPPSMFGEIIRSMDDRLDNFKAGRITCIVTAFQVCLLVICMLGFYITRYFISLSFMKSPIFLGVLGIAELGVLLWSGRFMQREEAKLVNDIRQMFRPWKEEYGIFAKVRKSRGTCMIGERSRSSTFYCVVLEKIGPNVDYHYDTESLTTTHTDDESDVDANE